MRESVTEADAARAGWVRAATAAALAAMFVCAIVVALATVRTSWHLVFDDAFITYRYAKNLATGHGLTWNVHERPTEGYTSLLHVLLLTPLLALRADPLLATRVLSFVAMLGSGALIVAFSTRQVRASLLASLLFVTPLFTSKAAHEIAWVGLETWLFAFALLAAWLQGESVLRAPTPRRRAAFVGVSFLALLTRPEALILFVVVSAVRAGVCVRGNRRQLRALALDVAAFALLVAVFVAWRWHHFHALLPNPAYLKTAAPGLTSARGVASVEAFFLTNWALLLSSALSAAVVAVAPELRRFRVSVLTSSLLVLAYLAFYTRVDALMDISGRFLFPLVPVLVWQTALAGSWWLDTCRRPRELAIAAGFLVLLPAGFGGQLPTLRASASRQVREGAEPPKRRSLMQREYDIGKSLAGFPRVQEVRVAFGDAGVIPYFTGAEWLDTVGLNDPFIARERDHRRLVDYFFAWNADLVIQHGTKQFTYVRHGHGPLGDDKRWASDPRWDGYKYVGTCRTDGRSYDLHFFVRKDSKLRAELRDYLRSQVVDGWYRPLPMRWGTRATEATEEAAQLARRRWQKRPRATEPSDP